MRCKCLTKIKVYNEKYLVNENLKENIIEVLTANAIRSLDTDITYNSKIYEILKNQDQYRAYEVENNFKSKDLLCVAERVKSDLGFKFSLLLYETLSIFGNIEAKRELKNCETNSYLRES